MHDRPTPSKPRGPAGFAAYLPIAERGLPFTSNDGRAFMRVPAATAGGYIALAVRSRAFREWFFIHSFTQYDTVPTAQTWNAICRHIEAQALREKTRRDVPVGCRIARSGSPDAPKILIDLANPDGQFVEVTPEGWQVAIATYTPSKPLLPLTRSLTPSEPSSPTVLNGPPPIS